MSPTPRYFCLKTLLDCDPDVNRRTVNRGSDYKELVVMNAAMRPWTESDKMLLAELIKSESDDELRSKAEANGLRYLE